MPNRIHFYSQHFREIGPALQDVFPDAEIVSWQSEEEFRAGIAEVEFLLTFAPPRTYWPQARKLKLVQSLTAGVDHLLPMDGLPDDVQVAKATGIMAETMADFALALTLMLLKRINWAVDAQRRHEWGRFASPSLARSTLGILGTGSVGLVLARKAKALDMRVVGTRFNPGPTENVDQVFSSDETARVMEQSDVVVALLPGTPETRGLIDAGMLRAMPKGAALISMGRGGQVDETALAAALRDGHLSGAALDVFEQEPLPPTSELWDTPNLVLTPHTSGTYPGYLDDLVQLFARNVGLVEQGQPPLAPVDLEHGY